MTRFLAVLLACLPIRGLKAGNLPQLIAADTVLTASGNPHRLGQNMIVAAGANLTLAPETLLLIEPDVCIYVYGSLQMQGAAGREIILQPFAEGGKWGGIYFDGSTDTCRMSHARLLGGSQIPDAAHGLAVVSGHNAHLRLDNVAFGQNGQCIFTFGGSVEVQGCHFLPDNGNEHINIKHSAQALVNGCLFESVNKGDAIDYDGVTGGIISNNEIRGSIDDGIDVGDTSINVLIANNMVFDCNDNGITVGEHSSLRLSRNLVDNCKRSFEVKDGAGAVLEHNTFVNHHKAAILAYEYVEGMGPGTAWVENCIFAQSQQEVLDIGDGATVTINHTLCDTETLPGIGNLLADPLFAAPADHDYSLLPESPCINAGNPQSPPDVDGTVADLGAFPFNFDQYPIGRGNFPNPFASNTVFGFETVQAGELEFFVYDTWGRLVYKRREEVGMGKQLITWQAAGLPPGVYIYRLLSAGKTLMEGKALLVR